MTAAGSVTPQPPRASEGASLAGPDQESLSSYLLPEQAGVQDILSGRETAMYWVSEVL